MAHDPPQPVQLLIFTDLDNTLLDHHSYDCTPALPLLHRLKKRGIPVIPATSKTLAEMAHLQAQLPLAGPCIAENGSLIHIPAGTLSATDSRRILGTERKEILAVLQALREQGFHFVGFGDMALQQVMRLTGLDRGSATRALERQASEPLVWEGTPAELEEFSTHLRQHGLKIVRGGRFLHVMGQCDKADALLFLRDRYRPCWSQSELVTVALGDSHNDRDMLGVADIAIIMGDPESAAVEAAGQLQTHHAGGFGPLFWARAVESLLNYFAL